MTPIDPSAGTDATGRHLAEYVGGKPGVWLTGLRDTVSLVRVRDRSDIQIGRDLLTLYWGCHFHELSGLETLSYLGEPEQRFFHVVAEWARDPRNAAKQIHRVRLVPQVRPSLSPFGQ